MITIYFTLAGMLLLVAQVAAMDGLLAIQRLCREFDSAIGHDTLIFPDYKITQ